MPVQGLGEWGYMAIGVSAALPCVILPYLLNPKAEGEKPFLQRYWVKANIWIAIFSFIGNYFWTHYFYQLLGASYTFPAHQLNKVCPLNFRHEVHWKLLS
jgi:cycloeucalenol cycloisomerase